MGWGIPLNMEFPNLYNICENKGVLVGDCWEGGGWKVCFRKPLGHNDFREWERLMDIVEEFRLNGEQDHIIWLLDKSKTYSTKSMYRRLTFRGSLIKGWSNLEKYTS